MKQFPGANVGARRILRYTADASMSFYHYAGLFHFYSLVLSLVTQDKREQAFFSLQHEVEKLKKMSLSEFTEFVKQNAPEKNARYGIEVPAAVIPVATPEVSVESVDDFVVIEHSPAPAPTETTRTSMWCSWFKSKEPEKQPLLAQVDEKSDEEIMRGFVNV